MPSRRPVRLMPRRSPRLNVPLETRLRQVAINLERWRWIPDDLGDRHFLVNIPYFHLIAREHGQAGHGHPRRRRQARQRDADLQRRDDEVVFSPYWNIPETIALEETAPAVARDPDYLSRNNMEVITAAGRVVPAESTFRGTMKGRCAGCRSVSGPARPTRWDS